MSDTLVGRVREIESLSKRIVDGNVDLLTIWGPGGIGKTRLARELARRVAPSFPGGVTFAALDGARRAADVVTLVARALGVTATPRSHEARVARIGHALAARGKTLVVLDNVEQIVDVTCAALAAWRAAAPNASFLVTSRELLGAAGESPCELAPLGVPKSDAEVASSEAVDLLLARARAVRADFEGNPRDLREIVARLDGIPLAIELAAARLAVLSASQLAERLDRRFEVLAAAHGGAEARQRTLRGAIDWSWDLLDDAERRALAELSVFEGMFDLEAAEAVLASRDSAADLLHALRSKSLLVAHAAEKRASGPRFSLLESIRDYARAKLGDRAREVEARHATYFVRAAEAHAARVDAHDGEEAIGWLVREQANLLVVIDRVCEGELGDAETALRAALAIEPMLAVHGAPALVVDLLGRVESMGKMAGFPIALRVRALEAKGTALLALGQLQEAMVAIERGLAEAAGDLERARFQLVASAIRQAQGRYDEAMRTAREALDLATRIDAKREIGVALSSIALVHHITEKFAEALESYREALAIHVEIGHLRAEIRTRARLGFLMQDLGRSEEAIAECERARLAEEKLDSRQLEGVLVGYIGNMRRAQGRTEDARQEYVRALELLRRAGDRRFEATFTMDRGISWILDANYTNAICDLEIAARIIDEVGDRKLAALIAGYEICARVPLGDRSGALAAIARGAKSLESVNDAAARTLFDVHAAQIHLLEASEADDEAERTRHVDLAARVLASLDRPILGEHRRIAAMLLAREIDRASASEKTLLVAPGGEAMRAPTNAWVDLSAHPSAGRVLELLVRRRLASPGTPVTAGELVAAGWPGEKLLHAAGVNRLRVLLTSLRAEGLREILKGEQGSYWIDPAVPVAWQKSPIPRD